MRALKNRWLGLVAVALAGSAVLLISALWIPSEQYARRIAVHSFQDYLESQDIDGALLIGPRLVHDVGGYIHVFVWEYETEQDDKLVVTVGISRGGMPTLTRGVYPFPDPDIAYLRIVEIEDGLRETPGQ